MQHTFGRSTSPVRGGAATTPLTVDFCAVWWSPTAVRLLFVTPEPNATPVIFFSFICPILLEVSDLESSTALGRAGGIFGGSKSSRRDTEGLRMGFQGHIAVNGCFIDSKRHTEVGFRVACGRVIAHHSANFGAGESDATYDVLVRVHRAFTADPGAMQGHQTLCRRLQILPW